MTGTPQGHWIQCLVCQVKERPVIKGKNGEPDQHQPDELTFHSSYGQAAVVLKQKPPRRPVPPGEMPPLPAGVKRTSEDRVLVYDIQDNGDRELTGLEIAACRNWLFWRWGQNQNALVAKVEA